MINLQVGAPSAPPQFVAIFGAFRSRVNGAGLALHRYRQPSPGSGRRTAADCPRPDGRPASVSRPGRRPRHAGARQISASPTLRHAGALGLVTLDEDDTVILVGVTERKPTVDEQTMLTSSD